MFPVVRIRVRGLDARAMYNVVLEFVQTDEYKWKYTDGRWQKSGKAEPQPMLNSYVHPDSPNFGEKWMRDVVSFSKLKFTNKDNTQNWVSKISEFEKLSAKSFKGTNESLFCHESQILLNSMHHYQPTVKIYRIDPNDHEASQTLVTSIALSVSV